MQPLARNQLSKRPWRALSILATFFIGAGRERLSDQQEPLVMLPGRPRLAVKREFCGRVEK